MATTKKLPDWLRDLTPPPPDSRVGYRLLRDPDTRRLHLRITRAGAKSWVHIGARSFTIGSFSDWPYQLAREEAHRLNRLVDLGQDLHTDREAKKGALTVSELIELWREDIHRTVPPKIRPRTESEYLNMIEQWIGPVLGKKRITDIQRDDIRDLHTKITKEGRRRPKPGQEGTPTRANHVVALCSTLFGFAVKKGLLVANPTRGVERNAEEKRERMLTGEEFQRLWASIDQCRYEQPKRALKLLLLTGSRRNEILRMKWDQLDLTSDNTSTWFKPSPTVKQKKSHLIPLAGLARDILLEIRQEQQERADRTGREPPRWVFPAAGKRDEPVQEIKVSWRNVCQRANIKNFRLHDMRHAFASFFVSTGTSLSITGKLLGHSQARTTERYAHIHTDPLRAEVARFAEFVKALESKPIGSVIKLPTHKTDSAA